MGRAPAELAAEVPDTAEREPVGSERHGRVASFLSRIPRGNLLDEESWHRRHRVLQWVLGVHVPALLVLAIVLGEDLRFTIYLLLAPAALLVGSQVVQQRRRLASVLITAGLAYCSAALVVITHGTIEAHFHFFIIIGLIALYQDWIPFGYNIAFTVLSHGIGSIWFPQLVFAHTAGQQNPWLWSAIHGIGVLLASAGVVTFWSVTEDEQHERYDLNRQLAEAKIADAKAAQESASLEGINAVFLNIARRSQAIVHRQLQVLDQAERAEENPDQLGLLFQLDHLTTRERRNAENLIILGGGQPGRQWRNPVPLLEMVRSAASETEQYTRVALGRMPRILVAGHAVADIIHLIAELLDNATSFSPPGARIEVRSNRVGKGVVLEIEDQGLGIEPERLEELNEMLRSNAALGPQSQSQSQDWRLGLFVVTKLAHRHNITVTLVESSYGGVRAIVLIPTALLTEPEDGPGEEGGDDQGGDLGPALRAAGNGHQPDAGPTRNSPSPLMLVDDVDQAAPAAPKPALISRPAPRPKPKPVGGGSKPALPTRSAPAPAAVPTAAPVVDDVPTNGTVDTAVAPGRHSTDLPTPGRPGLPTRRRQAHVAPELRDAPAAADDSPAVSAEAVPVAADADDQAAQRARSRMSALQRGSVGARVEADDPDS